tara:strand:+ start:7057 stop:8046 length:990 start_codon:yes stop_codon:yes gene_type:complete
LYYVFSFIIFTSDFLLKSFVFRIIMKFAIRDDDLNFFYTPRMIENNIRDIWDICPISMSVIPFVKGNWIENTKMLESLGPKNISGNIIKNIKQDNEIYDIAKNSELVLYIKNQIENKRVYLTVHAIHHRNEDENLPQLNNNFSIGAEFYTNLDLTTQLKKSVEHLEDTFGQKISVFTPPQNMYSQKGFNAISSNLLNICCYPLQLKKDFFKYIKMYGFANVVKLINHRLNSKNFCHAPYPYVINTPTISIIDHKSLQPGTNINKLYESFDYVYSKNGNFVLSTHSYGFNHKMVGKDQTMGDALKKFLLYVKKKNMVEFVPVNQIFEESK